MSILEQVLELGAQLSPEERQQVINSWQDANDAPIELDEATKQMLDAAVARVESGVAVLIPAEEVHARLRAKLKP